MLTPWPMSVPDTLSARVPAEPPDERRVVMRYVLVAILTIVRLRAAKPGCVSVRRGLAASDSAETAVTVRFWPRTAVVGLAVIRNAATVMVVRVVVEIVPLPAVRT